MPNDYKIILGVFIAAVVLFYLPIGSILAAKTSGIQISIRKIIKYRFDGIPIYMIIDIANSLKDASIFIEIKELIKQYELGTNLYNVRDGLIEAYHQGLFLTFEKACLADRNGVDILRTIENTLSKNVEKKK